MQPSKKKRPRRPTNLPPVPPAAVLRTFLLAALAIVACGWAILSALSHPRRGAHAPAPSATVSAGEAEMPVPDIVPLD